MTYKSIITIFLENFTYSNNLQTIDYFGIENPTFSINTIYSCPILVAINVPFTYSGNYFIVNKVLSPPPSPTKSPKRSSTNIFSHSNCFSLSYEFTSSQLFSTSETLSFSEASSSKSFVQTFSLSFILTFIKKDLFHFHFLIKYLSYYMSHDEIYRSYTAINTNIESMYFFPYIIYFLSPSYLPTVISFLVIKKKGKTKEQVRLERTFLSNSEELMNRNHS